jgi:hypothetical protein
MDETLPLSQHDMLTGAECVGIAARVRKLERHWTRRSAGGFYSLGAASYLDATQGTEAYLAAAQVTNPVLLESFGDVYDRVLAFFRTLLDEAVSLDLRRAVPGFHVFVLRGEDRGEDSPAPRAHFDLQWQHAFPGTHPTGTLSFTLAIEAPSGGSGMAVWPLRYADPACLDSDIRAQALRQPPLVVRYEPGRLVLHDGLVLHAIGAVGARRAAGYRITLQGHGVRLGREWHLYW